MEYADILNINLFDCAGYGISHKIGFDKKSSLNYRMVSYKTFNFFQNDLILSKDNIDYIKNIAKSASIIQFNPVISHGEFGEPPVDQPDGFIKLDGHMLPGPINWIDILENTRAKKFVLYNGSVNLMKNSEKYYNFYKELGFNTLYSTPGYQTIMTDGYWCPYIPDDSLKIWKNTNNFNKYPIKICHSSTNDKIKNTEDLIWCVKHINSLYKKEIFSLHIIRNTPWNICMDIKKSCHINFDHMQGYCGIGSLEASMLGLINIVGITDENKKLMNDSIGGFDQCPWLIARNREELLQKLNELIRSNINFKMKQTKDWAINTYSTKKLVKRMEDIYFK